MTWQHPQHPPSLKQPKALSVKVVQHPQQLHPDEDGDEEVMLEEGGGDGAGEEEPGAGYDGTEFE